MKINFLWYFLFAGLICLSACDDDDDVPALEYQSGGTIKGIVTGTRQDDTTPISETFDYSQSTPGLYSGELISFYRVDEDDNSIQVNLIRQDISNGGYALVRFRLAADDLTKPLTPYMTLLYNVEKDNQVLSFTMNSNGNTFAITDFSFDRATGATKGKYELKGSNNSTNNAATVSGEFDATVKQLVD